MNDENGDHADDATWVLTSSFVILTMQSGFGMLEMGCSGRGHEVNIMLKNVYDARQSTASNGPVTAPVAVRRFERLWGIKI